MGPYATHKHDIGARTVLVGRINRSVFVAKIYDLLQTSTFGKAKANRNGLAIQFYQACGNIVSSLVGRKYADYVATVPGTQTSDAHLSMRGNIETFGKMLLNYEETLLVTFLSVGPFRPAAPGFRAEWAKPLSQFHLLTALVLFEHRNISVSLIVLQRSECW